MLELNHRAKCMLIEAKELDRRLGSGKNLLNVLGVARKEGALVLTTPRKEVTAPLANTELRVVAGTAAHFATAKEVAEQLGITEQQVKSAKHSEDGSIRSRVEQNVERVSDLALLRTLESLELLSPEVLASEKPKDVAAIAANMSKVYNNVKGRESGASSAVQFVVYAPSIKQENHYEVVEASS